MRGASAAVENFGNASNRASQAAEGHKLSLGRVERALASYVGHAAGANSVTEQLSTAFGAFALGGTVVTGILLGVGAIVAVYEKLTEGTRKAKEENDKFSKSLRDQTEAIHANSVEGRAAAYNKANDILAATKKETGAGFFSQLLQGMAPGGQSMGAMTSGDVAAHTKAVAGAASDAQQALNNYGMAIAGFYGDAPKAASAAAEVAGKLNELRDAAAKVNATIEAEGKGFWKNYIDSSTAALSITQQLANRIQSMQPSLLDALQALSQVGQGAPSFSMPSVSLDDGLTPAQIESRNKLIGNADKNASRIAAAIDQSAVAIGSIVVNALNIGGGGKGSSLGGAIGSTAGFVAGSFLPFPGGSAVGSLVGNVIGSAIGGLFDSNTKAVNANTAATRANTAALLLNSPQGFKVGYYDNQAADAKMIARLSRAQRQVSSRGGATGFALAGG